MKNPYMSETEYRRHTDEFLEAYYGAGRRYVKTYLDALVSESQGRHMSIWRRPSRL